jgi:hypothetical protein
MESNLPPGCIESRMPGNRLQDAARERAAEIAEKTMLSATPESEQRRREWWTQRLHQMGYARYQQLANALSHAPGCDLWALVTHLNACERALHDQALNFGPHLLPDADTRARAALERIIALLTDADDAMVDQEAVLHEEDGP